MPVEDHDLEAIRRQLEERRDRASERLAELAKRPERGSAQGFGKRIGDGTTEAISRLTEIGVGSSVEKGLIRTGRALAKLDEGTYGNCDACGGQIAPAGCRRCRTACCVWRAPPLSAALLLGAADTTPSGAFGKPRGDPRPW